MIRPTFQGFETAKRALNVAQMGLDTVGHNISNARTLGYTRQRVDQVSLSLSGSPSKFATFGVNSAGLGAMVSGVNQIRDPYLDNRYRAEASTNGELGVKYDGLTDINNIFDEIMTDGLHSKLGDLINALDIYAQQADSKELAMVVRNTASQLVSMINKSASRLEETRAQQTSQLKETVEYNVNVILEQIATLNQRIKEDNIYGNPSNELNDERNLLIDKLSEYLDIKVVRTPVKLSNGVTVERLSIELNNTEPPITLVNSGDYNKLRVNEDPESGNVSISVIDSISEAVIPNGENIRLQKGALKGFLDVLNGQGPNAGAGESSFRGIPYYQASLDEFAQKLAEIFNRVNNISEDEAKNSGDKNGTDPLLSMTYEKNLFTPLTLTLKGVNGGKVPQWINSMASGTVQFSGKVQSMSFDLSGIAKVPPQNGDSITATIDGISYTGTCDENGKITFLDDNGNTAFTISTSSMTPRAATDADENVIVDSTITAKNISLSSEWLNDALYITATKYNAIDDATASLKLTGGSNPAWIRSVELGGDGVKVPSGGYKFTYDSATPPTKIGVKIDGTTYWADLPLAPNSRVEFKDSSNNIGLIVNTTGKDVTEGTASVQYESGAANDNILKFKDAMTAANGYRVGGFSGNFQEFLVAFQSDMSLDKEVISTLLDASYTVISGYADRRNSVSAVSVDEEGIDMMTYQNYYNAAARYMNVLDEALDKIINGMGTVGR